MKSDLSKLKQELKSLSPANYETKDYESLTNIEQVRNLIRQVKGDLLKKRLKTCNPGQKDWKKFQDICLDLVKLTLEQSEFEECTTSSELQTQFVPLDSKGVRKDIVIPLTPKRVGNKGEIKTIWDEFRYDPWNCKYLVFDAKNYTSAIKDKQIYQMFHYLNGKNGRIGIIFSRKHTVDESGKAVLRRIREENYIVFVLNDNDLELWIDCFVKDGHVRTFFRDIKTKYDHSFLT